MKKLIYLENRWLIPVKNKLIIIIETKKWRDVCKAASSPYEIKIRVNENWRKKH